MIWTVPLGLELELPATMSDSSCQDFGIDCELQACCLSIAGAYLKSLPIPALVALVGAQCPGMHENDTTKRNLIYVLPLSLSLPLFL